MLVSDSSEAERDTEMAAINSQLHVVEYQQRIPFAAMEVRLLVCSSYHGLVTGLCIGCTCHNYTTRYCIYWNNS